jgi:DNA-directed RNA polymerase subunit RPC12/RpoP
MAAFEIPCPECGRLLRIPDRKMLGRKARCGKCGHRFILQEPGEPEVAEIEQPAGLDLEFASTDEDGADNDKTLMGVAARYVPQELVGSTPAPAGVQTPASRPATMPVAGAPIAPLELPIPVIEPPEDADTLARVRQRKRAAQRRRNITVGASVAGFLAVSIGLYVVLAGGQETRSKRKSRPAAAKIEPADDDEEVANATEPSEAETKPVEPISLTLVPEGARIITHLRPADLWQAGGSAEEFRACLGPLGVWLENVIKTRCLLEPAKIEEVLFALIPISRDEFDVSYVVRTKDVMKKSELIDKFDGELRDQPRQHYVGPERAWLILDTRTFASAPKNMVESFVQSANGNSVTSDGIRALLAKTDRKKHFTLVCELEDVRLGTKNLAPDNAQKLLEGILDFFGDDVETIAWNLHLGDVENSGNLASDLLVRNKLSRSPPKLEADLKKKLAGLPAEILNIAQKSDPKKIGEKKIVGRFPAMTKVVQELTHFNNSHRLVTMRVELPERAGPNLAIGTLFAWNQTTLPDYGKASSAMAEQEAKLLKALTKAAGGES